MKVKKIVFWCVLVFSVFLGARLAYLYPKSEYPYALLIITISIYLIGGFLALLRKLWK